MKLVIDVDEEIYNECKGEIYWPDTGEVIWESVRNGILLENFLIHMKDPINEEVVKSYIKQIKRNKDEVSN